jgi:hypothetical protein
MLLLLFVAWRPGQSFSYLLLVGNNNIKYCSCAITAAVVSGLSYLYEKTQFELIKMDH